MPKPSVPPQKKRKFNWVLARRVVLWTVVCAGLALGSMKVHSFVLRDARFVLHCDPGGAACEGLEIRGSLHSNPARIHEVFAQDAARSVFDIPLAERRRHLLALDWVLDASVSRIWPDRIRVDIQERVPVAFASLPMGGSARHRLELIDNQGVLLPLPPHTRFALPVLSGITEEQGEDERRKRVEAMLRLIAALGPRAREISEINAATPDNLKAVTPMDGNAVELWLGDKNFRTRYLNFVNHYKELRQDSHAAVFDLRLDDRILVR